MTSVIPECMIEIMLLNLVHNSNFDIPTKLILKDKLNKYYKENKSKEVSVIKKDTNKKDLNLKIEIKNIKIIY